MPRVPEPHWGINLRVVQTIPCDCIAEIATGTPTLATVAVATESTKAVSGLQANCNARAELLGGGMG